MIKKLFMKQKLRKTNTIKWIFIVLTAVLKNMEVLMKKKSKMLIANKHIWCDQTNAVSFEAG